MKQILQKDIVKSVVILHTDDVLDTQLMLTSFLPQLDEMLQKVGVEIVVTQMAGSSPDYEITVFKKGIKRTRRTKRGLLG